MKKMKLLIAANWKMNKDLEEAVSFVEKFKELVKDVNDKDIVIFPPFTLLKELSSSLSGSNIQVGAQNMHYEDKGAFTGEISPLMVKDTGCEYVMLGHSERREFFKEDDRLINKKLISALKHSINPILCVGENFKERKDGKTKEVLSSQLKNCLKNVSKDQILKIDIAYEPVWAISRGDPNHKAATAKDAEEGHKTIRGILENIYDEEIAKQVRVIYGGSMKPENAEELLSIPDINGGLVGNASLDPESFAQVCKS